MTNAPRLVFCFPYHGVGGVSMLFPRVAEELAKTIQQLVSEYPKLSNSARSHFEKYHAIGSVAKQLLQLAVNARCTYGDFSKARLTGRGTLYKCFDYLRKKHRKGLARCRSVQVITEVSIIGDNTQNLLPRHSGEGRNPGS